MVRKRREKVGIAVVVKNDETAGSISDTNSTVHKAILPVGESTVGVSCRDCPDNPGTGVRPVLPKVKRSVVFLRRTDLNDGNGENLIFQGIVIGSNAVYELRDDEEIIVAENAVAKNTAIGDVALPSAGPTDGVVAQKFEVVPAEVHCSGDEVNRFETEEAKGPGDGIATAELALQQVVESRQTLSGQDGQTLHQENGGGTHQDV